MTVVWREMRRLGAAIVMACLSANTSQGLAGTKDVDNVLRGTAELLRMSATYAPLPAYPRQLAQAGKSGLVVVEAVVSPAGTVLECRILETFDDSASMAVAAGVKSWRFRSLQELISVGLLKVGKDLLRINRLGFEFRMENGAGRVVDLVRDELTKDGGPDPFRNGQSEAR
jgi:TonB family protein